MAKITADQLQQASDAFGREMKRMEGLAAARAVFADMASLANHAQELEARIAAANRTLLQRDRELQQALDDTTKERKKAVEIGTAAAAECTRLKQMAEEQAKKTHADAVADAQRIVGEATAEADKILAAAAHEKRLANEVTETCKTALETASEALRQRQTELAELDRKLGALKAQAAQFAT